MAFEAVDACFGTPHISSDDLAALNEATIGKRDCVWKWGANRTGEGDVVLKVNADGTFAWQAQGGSQAVEPLYGVLVWAY